MPEIKISKKTKELIESFGLKKESHNKMVKRMYDMAVKEQLRRFLTSDENCISIDEAIKLAEERWPKKTPTKSN